MGHQDHATVRDDLVRQRRKADLIAYGGVILFFLGALIEIGFGMTLLFALLGLPGLMLWVFGHNWLIFGTHCPRCRGRIGRALQISYTPLVISPQVRYCPCCGVTLDSPVDEKPQG